MEDFQTEQIEENRPRFNLFRTRHNEKPLHNYNPFKLVNKLEESKRTPKKPKYKKYSKKQKKEVIELNKQLERKGLNYNKRIDRIYKLTGIAKRNISNWIENGIDDKRKNNPGRTSKYTEFFEDLSKEEFVKRVKAWQGKLQHDTIFKRLMPEFYLDQVRNFQKDYGFDVADILRTYSATVKKPKDDKIKRKHFSKTTGNSFRKLYKLTDIKHIKINGQERLVSFSFNGKSYTC